MKFFIFIAVFFCIIPNVYAQDPSQISSFKKLLSEEADQDTTRVHAYSMLCFHYSVLNTDTAVYYGRLGKELAAKIKNKRSLANINNSLGWAYFKKHDYVQAESLFLESVQTWKEMNLPDKEAMVMGNLGLLYMEKTEYTKSLSCMKQALNIHDSLKDEMASASNMHNTGRLYNLLKNYTEARKYFQQSLEIYRKKGNNTEAANEMMSIGNTLRFEKKNEEAIQYYDKAIPFFIKNGNHSSLGLSFENKAGAYGAMKNYSMALRQYDLAIEQYSIIESKTDMYYALAGKTDIYTLMHDFPNAVKFGNEALAIAKELDDHNMQYEITGKIAEIYQKLADYKHAYTMLLQSNIIKDSLFTIDKQTELLKLQTEFETERKEKENQLLKVQNDAANTKLQRNTILLIASAIGLVMLGYLVFNFYHNKEAKAKHIAELEKLNMQLNLQQEEIKRFNTLLQLKALRAQMNPHFIFNCMSSIQECMLTGRVDDANTYLTKLSRLLRMVLNYSDDESIALDKELEMLRLYLSLENIRLKGSFEYNIDVEEDLNTEDIQVPTLLLQPFAENAIWHGLVNKTGKRNLDIAIHAEDELLHFSIKDNGVGREKASELKRLKKSHESKGMNLIEKRLDILKQKYPGSNAGYTVHDIKDENREPAGTLVEIILPLTLL